MAQKLVTTAIENALKKTPYGTTDGIPKADKKVIARYFLTGTGCTWYVLEDDEYFADEGKTTPTIGKNVYGAATLGYGLELGSISLTEVFALKNRFGLGVERDISVEPLKRTLGELIKLHGEEWM